MSLKLIFEYSADDEEEIIDKVAEFISEEILQNKDGREYAFVTAFGGEPLDWIRLKAHIVEHHAVEHPDHGSITVDNSDDAIKMFRKQQAEAKMKRKQKKSDGDKGGLDDFLNRM